MSSPLKQNTTTIQELLNTINSLPEAENLDTEISTQTTLLSEQDAKIAELAQVLAGKAGGGSSTTSYDTCTVNINVSGSSAVLINRVIYTTINSNGNIETVINTTATSSHSLTCLCGTLVITDCSMSPFYYELSKIESLDWISQANIRAFNITAGKDEIATITCSFNGTGGSSGGSD